jgi:hypothetical protein
MSSHWALISNAHVLLSSSGWIWIEGGADVSNSESIVDAMLTLWLRDTGMFRVGGASDRVFNSRVGAYVSTQTSASEVEIRGLKSTPRQKRNARCRGQQSIVKHRTQTYKCAWHCIIGDIV